MPFNINKYNLFLNGRKHGTGVMKYANGHQSVHKSIPTDLYESKEHQYWPKITKERPKKWSEIFLI